MKLLAISDVHGRSWAASEAALLASKENFDAIILSGDLSPYMSLETAREILEILVESGVPIFYVPGNMDDPKLTSNLNIKGTHNLHRKCIEFKEVKIIGVGGGLVGPFKTPLEYSEEEFSKMLNELSSKISNEKFILVTHNPPFKTLADKLDWGEHVGSISIRKFIEKQKPILNVCGHIHEARCIDRIGETIIVNPGPAMRGYYAEIIIEEECQVLAKLMRMPKIEY